MEDIRFIIDDLQPFPIWDNIEKIQAKCTELGIVPNFQGWLTNYDVFRKIIDELQPRLIIEVGAWKGLSTAVMADRIQATKLESHIIVVDTWLGSTEHWIDVDENISSFLRNGYPIGLYYQFLCNMIDGGYTDIVTPFPQTSRGAAEYFRQKGIKASLIYLDGSHLYEDIVLDLEDYWGILEPGGIMFGDDYGKIWDGVTRAVDEFEEKAGVKKQIYTINDFHMWTFQKEDKKGDKKEDG